MLYIPVGLLSLVLAKSFELRIYICLQHFDVWHALVTHDDWRRVTRSGPTTGNWFKVCLLNCMAIIQQVSSIKTHWSSARLASPIGVLSTFKTFLRLSKNYQKWKHNSAKTICTALIVAGDLSAKRIWLIRKRLIDHSSVESWTVKRTLIMQTRI